MFLAFEAGLALLAGALAFLVPNLGSRWFEAWERRFSKLAGKRGLSVLIVGLVALGARAALLPILPVPQPGVQDGFAYRLLADTFAHGRLTNPTNPMWRHFETFHIIWQPTYTTKFYPAQGLIMALGQVVLGLPFWGVWLSIGLMCAAITWMLQGWLEPGWALLGGLLAVIRLGTFSYWANGYAGGAMAALGGALVLGALPRLKQEQRPRHALLMGLGFAILANSRPYEGLFFGIPVAVALLVWLWKKKRPSLVRALKRVIAPLLAVLALTIIAMGYYFWRTTGSPWNMPYSVYAHTYDPVPNFPWRSIEPVPVYHHEIFRDFYLGFFLDQYKASRTLIGLIRTEFIAVLQFWSFYLGVAFTLPLLLVSLTIPYGWSWKEISPNTRFLLLVCGVTLAGEALAIWYNPHYSAPITCAILALVLIALRRLRPWQWRSKPVGLFITRAVPAVCVLLLGLRVAAGPLHLPSPPRWPVKGMPTWCTLPVMNAERAAMLARLRHYPGWQLVIVHYNPGHEINFHEWVYNRADINSAKVIWARDMGPAENEELIQYFKKRHAWVVDADDHPPKLLPYSEAMDRPSQAAAAKTP
jgi:hypothetical protein